MYKSIYYTKKQMTKYEMQTGVSKTWLHTLQFFTKRFAQCKVYRDDCAANSIFDSAVHINNIPTNCSLVSTSSNITTRDLYIQSLEESLEAAREYDAKERTPTPDKPNPAALLHMELDTQHKQFDLVMKQNSTILAALAKGNGGEGGGGSGVSGSNRCNDRGTKAMCPNCNKMVPTVSCSQQTRSRFHPGTSPPTWVDRDRGP